MTLRQPVLWIHGEALGPANPALLTHPGRPALFVFDEAPISLKQLAFLYECVLELPVTIRRGDVATEVISFAAHHGGDGVVTSQAVDPRFERIRARIAEALPVEVLEPEPFVSLTEPVDLKRFGRYWKQAEPRIWAPWVPPP